MSNIKITPEYWGQPGSIRYNYRDNANRTLWNVDSVTSQGNVRLWTINANGQTHFRTMPRDKFDEAMSPHDAPSMYEQMDKAAGR